MSKSTKVNEGSVAKESSCSLKWYEMPYEGCGVMYECPHYCPTHLFAASKPSETCKEKQPLQVTLTKALKSKFEVYQAELHKEYQELLEKLKNEQDSEIWRSDNEASVSIKDAGVEQLDPVSAHGDSPASPKPGKTQTEGEPSPSSVPANITKDANQSSKHHNPLKGVGKPLPPSNIERCLATIFPCSRFKFKISPGSLLYPI